MKPYITDLAAELLRHTPHHDKGISVNMKRADGIKIMTMQITNEMGARQIGKPVGTYINLECDTETENSPTPSAPSAQSAPSATPAPSAPPATPTPSASSAPSTPPATPVPSATSASSGEMQNLLPNLISGKLQRLLPKKSRVLVVGLGNDRFVADSLGPKVLSFINTGERLMTFEPNVKGITGINSVDAIKQIVKLCKPNCVIVIDSLVSVSADKIGTNYQIATSGITPGSGIGRDNKRLDEDFLGVPVLAIGVPICTIITAKRKTLHATVKEIDQIIINCALNIANGINGAVFI
ncbi:MAG: GPR endopeptidase [Christensenellaceae bacterium]|jgi:hypothetical protein|nr:GPR endopeptidase [Christensenellaceae bacterium]